VLHREGGGRSRGGGGRRQLAIRFGVSAVAWSSMLSVASISNHAPFCNNGPTPNLSTSPTMLPHSLRTHSLMQTTHPSLLTHPT
jgi:hypothetical protein